MTPQLEGKNPILEALKADRPIDKILISKDIERHTAIANILHLAKQKGVPVLYVERAKLDQVSQTRSHQGIIAYAAEKKYSELEDILGMAKQKNEAPFIIILDGIEDPHNMGAIIRSAEATGVHGIIIQKRRTVGLTPIVAKTSSGAIEHMPVARVTNLTEIIKKLKEENVWIVGVESGEKKEYTKYDFKSPVAIVIGGEGKGISRLVKENCDELVSISMKGKISSLNASVAAAVVMYEVVRQRNNNSIL